LCTGDVYPSTGFKLFDMLIVNILGGFFGSYLGLGASAMETAKAK
jgi:hypothetical protein